MDKEKNAYGILLYCTLDNMDFEFQKMRQSLEAKGWKIAERSSNSRTLELDNR